MIPLARFSDLFRHVVFDTILEFQYARYSLPSIATFANQEGMHEVRGHCRQITNGMQTIRLLALDRVIVTANALHYSRNRN
jgi:hypothetical protein